DVHRPQAPADRRLRHRAIWLICAKRHESTMNERPEEDSSPDPRRPAAGANGAATPGPASAGTGGAAGNGLTAAGTAGAAAGKGGGAPAPAGGGGGAAPQGA